jgi:hypothetical protein
MTMDRHETEATARDITRRHAAVALPAAAVLTGYRGAPRAHRPPAHDGSSPTGAPEPRWCATTVGACRWPAS